MPIELVGPEHIKIGSRVYVGPGCWLLTHEPAGRLEIGSDTSISGYCVFSAAAEVRIGRSVLFARNSSSRITATASMTRSDRLSISR